MVVFGKKSTLEMKSSVFLWTTAVHLIIFVVNLTAIDRRDPYNIEKMHEHEIRFTHISLMTQLDFGLLILVKMWFEVNYYCSYVQNLKISLKSSSFACQTDSIFLSFLSAVFCVHFPTFTFEIPKTQSICR